jgi:hypothetical protein
MYGEFASCGDSDTGCPPPLKNTAGSSFIVLGGPQGQAGLFARQAS